MMDALREAEPRMVLLTLSWGFLFEEADNFYSENWTSSNVLRLKAEANSKYDQDDQTLIKHVTMQSNSKYAFGPFRLVIEQRLLFRDNEQVRFSILKFELLKILLDHRDAVVLYDIFWKEVWGEAHQPTEDLRPHTHKVNVHIDEIRQILGEYGECIESLRGRGYRFKNNILEGIEREKASTPKDTVRPSHSRPVTTQILSNRNLNQDIGQDYNDDKPLASDSDETVIREMARIFEKDEAVLAEQVFAQRGLSSELQQAETKIRTERLSNRLLHLYYPDEDLRASHLARYAVHVDGQLVETNIAVSREREPLLIDLKQKQFRHLERSSQIPTFPDDILISAIADCLKEDVRIKNNPVFCLYEFDPTLSKASVDFYLAEYFAYRATFGSLESELIRSLFEAKFNPEEVMQQREYSLKRRNILLPDVLSLTSVSQNICVGGVNVVLALRRDGPHHDFAFFVGERSRNVASARGTRCLIPSGFHQPFEWGSASEEVSIAVSVFRELWEELFRGNEVISHDGHLKPDWYFKYPQLGWFAKKGVNFVHEIVSFGLHLKDGSYQFGILLVINDPEYWDVYGNDMVPNYEFKHSGTHARVISTKNGQALTELLTDPLCANASVFAVSEALLRLKSLAPDRVVLPLIKIANPS